MKKTFIDLEGNPFEVDFIEHDIKKYDVLFHVSLKERKKGIEENGLLISQSQYKSLVKTDMLFFSYPIDMNTSDCFRFNDDVNCLIILDAKALCEAGYIFYDDHFSRKDASSKRNHLAIDKNIPKEFIKKIIEF